MATKKAPAQKKTARTAPYPAKISRTIIRPTIRKTPKDLPDFPTTTWGSDSIISFNATDQLPPKHLTSIAGGMVFFEDRVVLANVPGRGWEMIGGRIDLGESPEATFRREASDQLGVELSHVSMLGLLRVEHKGAKPPNCPYPFPIAYGVQFIGIAKELMPFKGGSDSLSRSLISLGGLPKHYYGWDAYYEAVFKYAFSEYQRWRKKLKL